MNSTILVIVAHHDDETLGCGGTVSKLSKQGVEVYGLILSEGLTSRSPRICTDAPLPVHAFDELKKDALDATERAGYKQVYFESFPNNRMDGMELLDIIHILHTYIQQIQPSVILTHHHSDINIDHQITHKAALTACRPLPGCPVRRFYSFEIPSSTEWNFPYHKNMFSPNVFVDISETIDDKIAAMECYRTERRMPPHPRSPQILRAIAAQRGSVVNMQYAEAFELIYNLDGISCAQGL